MTDHTHEVNRIRFSQDGSRLVTASSDATCRVYQVPDGRQVSIIRGHDETVLTHISRRMVTELSPPQPMATSASGKQTRAKGLPC
ncbi:MAG TPA: hypothetical protein EYG03_11750 [Planctomycetes bacterium]|nr:hypothetical protein [Fuerstiella sp.]HIK92641.1 hypothetical protein [Planctomycetota bacterium]